MSSPVLGKNHDEVVPRIDLASGGSAWFGVPASALQHEPSDSTDSKQR
jgi:hypothetical protein